MSATRSVPFERLTPEELDAWRALFDALPEPRSPFLSPAYARAVAQARPGVRVCVLREAGRPVGFLPFQFASASARALLAAEPVGGDMSDAFGLVARAGVRTTPAELLRAAGLRSLLFTHLVEAQREHGLTGDERAPGLAIDLPAGGAARWEELRVERKGFVDKTERRERQLAEELGPLELSFESPDPRRELADLIARKREQYARTGARDVLAEPWRRRLLEHLAETREPGCTGLLSTLRAGGRFVAAHFGLRSGGLLHYWFPVYEPELARYSPGRLLLKAILFAADEHGLGAIDRGAGDTQAKRELANRERVYASGLWQRPGPRAAAFRALCSLAWRIAPSER